MESQKPKRRKLNVKKLLVLILVIYLVIYGAFYLSQRPIKNIVINGNDLINDAQIIRIAKLENYPSIFSINTKSIEKKLTSLTLIENVTVKKDFKFRLIINVTEAKPLYLNQANNKIKLSNGEYIDNSNEYIGIPSLINYADETILKVFTSKLKTIDNGILSLISEIEYAPVTSEDGKIIDETRFILYMNDGNEVHINVNKYKNLNRYREIYAGLKNVKGIIYLDNGQNGYFEPYGEKETNEL